MPLAISTAAPVNRSSSQPAARTYFADSSALARSYLEDEVDSAALRQLLLLGDDAVLASQLAHLEVAAGLTTARRQGRIDDTTLAQLLVEYQDHVAENGQILVLPLVPEPVLARARQIVLDHPIRMLDALHLAVAEDAARTLAGDDELVFVTRDARQRAVAETLGLATA